MMLLMMTYARHLSRRWHPSALLQRGFITKHGEPPIFWEFELEGHRQEDGAGCGAVGGQRGGDRVGVGNPYPPLRGACVATTSLTTACCIYKRSLLRIRRSTTLL